jgi:hypothetical protein
MAVLVKRDHASGRTRHQRSHGSQGLAQWRYTSEWVSERSLRSRDFESFAVEPSAEDIERTTKRIAQASSEAVPIRTGRGSLRGKLVMADDWDSDEVNSAIARDFGLES